jgi:hypothetical protein
MDSMILSRSHISDHGFCKLTIIGQVQLNVLSFQYSLLKNISSNMLLFKYFKFFFFFAIMHQILKFLMS